jgi:excisionase family DNA binding protein
MYDPSNDTIAALLPRNAILTVAEVAKALRVSEETVRRLGEQWHDSGGIEGLPGFKVGKQWRFHRADVLKYLRARLPSASA